MRCYECGYQNEGGVKVCVKCGTKLDENASTPKPQAPPKPPAPAAGQGGAKTIRGQAATAPSWDKPTEPVSTPSPSTSSNIIKCSSCGYYPLQSSPSASNPCPNCGFGESKADNGSKTVKVESINLGNEGETKNSFKLVDEKSGREISFNGNHVNVNRDSLAPDNNTISSSVHATFSFENDQLLIEDKSSNGSTFIKVEGKMTVQNGSKIVIGNKVFTLKMD